MIVIAMTRETGARGKDVAAGLALELGLDVVHHELVAEHISGRLGVHESYVHRFLEGRPSLRDRWKIDPRRMSRYTAEEIRELAVRGNVIIRGCGAVQSLADIPHVVRVRICAPMSSRIDELVERLNQVTWEKSKPIEHAPEIVRDRMIVSRRDVRREIIRNDRAHARAVYNLLGQKWREHTQYDIVLDTSKIPIEDCVSQLVALVRSKDQ